MIGGLSFEGIFEMMYLVAFGGDIGLSTHIVSAESKQDAVYQAIIMAKFDSPEEFKTLTFEQQKTAVAKSFGEVICSQLKGVSEEMCFIVSDVADSKTLFSTPLSWPQCLSCG